MSGQTINERYRIQKKLSAKTECSIYLAEDQHRFNESCIVKEYGQDLAKVQLEAKILYQLDHPQIVSFRESFTLIRETKEYTYLVEDYIEGLSYSELSRLYESHAQRLNEKEIIERLKQILPVLDYLHSQGIVHGNLSPSSIIESSEARQPILIDFNLARYDFSALTEDIASLARMTLSLVTEKDSFSSGMSNLLEAMQQGKYQSASALAAALENLELNPTLTESNPTTFIPPVQSPSIATNSKSFNPLFGCLAKIFLVLGLSFSAGALGWLAGKYWIEGHKPETPKYTSDLIKKPSDSPESSPTPTVENNSLRERLLGLKISDESFFRELVDQVFDSRYPEEKGKIKDANTQKQWDQVATEILDKLSTLRTEVLNGLGKYTESDFNRWRSEVNRLHLSSRALYNLADGIFYSWFPEQQQNQTRPSFQGQPIGKVWDALVYSQLFSLKSGDNYQELTSLQSPLKGTLQPGLGQTYSIHLSQGKPLQIKLEPMNGLQLSVYSPTGKQNLLEDSVTGQWSGVLPETGYYEIVLISKAKQPIDYQLDIQ